MKSSHPVERRDRAWLNGRSVFLLGPIPLPPLDQIRDVVAGLIRQYPDSRLNWRLNQDRTRWIADRSPESIVSEAVWDGDFDYGRVLEDLKHGRLAEEPVSFVRYPDHLGMAVSHGCGDGRHMSAALGSILCATMGGELKEWASGTTTRFPLLSAAARTFGPHPAAVVQAIRDRPSLEPRAVVEAMSPWVPASRTEVVWFSKSLTDELAAWGRGRSPRASRFALMTCALLRALAAAGLPVEPRVNVLVDLRRYLGQGWIDGNFIANVPMRIDTATTPEQLSAMMKHTILSGRPVANQMVTSWRTGGRRRQRNQQASSANLLAPVQVTVTDLGDMPYFGDNPVLAELESCVSGASGVPGSPNGITAAVVHTPQTTTVSLAFHENVVDPHMVRRALALLATSPLALLTDRSLVP